MGIHRINTLIDLFLNSLSSQWTSTFTSFLFFISVILLLALSLFYIQQPSHRKVYLLDFACFKAPSSLMITKAGFIELYKSVSVNQGKEIVDFMKIAMDKAGLGDSTYFPEESLRVPPNPSMESSKKEAEMVMLGAIDELFAKNKNVDIREIGILIVNSCVFNVIPCLASMIVNRYKLREDVKSYNVTGMGCCAGLLGISLAKNLLQVHANQYALVVSAEILTEQLYLGKQKSKLSANCIFRVGGSATLLSNLSSNRKSSKYELLYNVHINNAKSDISYRSIFLEEDSDGFLGTNVNKDLLVAAKSAIESNVAVLGRLILPLSEKFRFLRSILVRNYKGSRLVYSLLNKSVPERYVPKLNKCVEHFFPHVGGKPVLDELQKIFGFSDATMEAPRMTLYRFGNTASSSVWYEMAYAEAKGRIKKGDRLWQMAFGSGFKCSSLVWRALRRIENEERNPWNDEIDQFPVNLDGIGTLDSKTFYFEPTT